MLINSGNLVNAATPSTDTAYIQLLPITNATQAAEDFASVRGGAGGATGEEIGNQFSSVHASSSKSQVLGGTMADRRHSLLLSPPPHQEWLAA